MLACLGGPHLSVPEAEELLKTSGRKWEWRKEESRKYIRGKRGTESRNVESTQVGVFHNETLVRWRLY